LTEELWNLIKLKPDLKRVLVNEPSRHLGPNGPGSQLFSKKDLQRTIAQMLFQDSGYNVNDSQIMENLTRAVKNKLHKCVLVPTGMFDNRGTALLSGHTAYALVELKCYTTHR
jgi:hypothetical protein